MKRKRQAQRAADGWWVTPVSAEAVRENEMTTVSAGSEQIVLTRLDGQIVAFARICPHAAADLAAGSLSRGRVTCPDHGWKFDIRSGRTLWPEDEGCRLRRFSVLVRDALVAVAVETP